MPRSVERGRTEVVDKVGGGCRTEVGGDAGVVAEDGEEVGEAGTQSGRRPEVVVDPRRMRRRPGTHAGVASSKARWRGWRRRGGEARGGVVDAGGRSGAVVDELGAARRSREDAEVGDVGAAGGGAMPEEGAPRLRRRDGVGGVEVGV